MCGTLAQLEHCSQIIIRVTYVLTYSTQVIVIVKLYASKSKLAWMYKNRNFSHYSVPKIVSMYTYLLL